MENGIRLDIAGGINTITSADQIPAGGGFPYLCNVRRNLKSRTVARFPLGSNLLTSVLANGIVSVARLNDPYKEPSYAYLCGSNGGLYVGATQVASGLSGLPISFLPYRPPASPQPWCYVADSSLAVNIPSYTTAGYGAVSGMLKVRSDGTVYKSGIKEPQSAPVIQITKTGTSSNWVSYRYVYRCSKTGALSNPSPESAPLITPLTSVAGTVNATQYQTNLVYNTNQYEFNSNEMRTKGGVSPGTLTDYVFAYGFGLNVPTVDSNGEIVSISGVTVALNWIGQYAGTGFLENVALYYGGSVMGTVKSPGTENAQSSTTVPQGGASDTWGATLTPEIVNDSSFGFGVQVLTASSGGSDRSFLISFTVTVYYSTTSATGTCVASTDPQVDTIDVYKQTQGLDNFTYTLSVPNSDPSFSDTLSDTQISSNPILYYDNYEPFPSIDLPRSGTCNVTAVNQEVTGISILTAGSSQTNGTFNIAASGGGGSGAVVQITIAGGIITDATVTSAGTGYTSAPTFTVSEGGTAGTLAATISPTLPIAPNIEWVSGDTFNPRWLPGTIILIAGVAYTLYNRPESTTELLCYSSTTSSTGYITYGWPPAATGATWSIAEPDLAAQPSPVIWGPTPDNAGSFYFGLDPLNPGDLVWSKGNNFDSAPDTNRMYICSPSESLMNGTVTSELSTVFSTERFWLLYSNFSDAVAAVTGTLGQQWTPVQSASTRGLYMRYAIGALASLIAWRAKDGIFVSQGGGPEQDISANIYNLFPHGEQASPSPVVIGGNTIYPPDDTKPNAQTISLVPGYIFYDYQDTAGTPRTLVYDMEAKGWVVDSYTPAVNCHALAVGVNQILCGCTDGTVRAFESAGTESGTAIIMTPAENKGSTRVVKRIGGVFLRAMAASAITLAFWANRIHTAITGFSPSTAGTGSGENDYLIDFTGATNADVKDLACQFSWPIGSGNILSEWQPDWTYLPAAVIGWKTGLLSYGLQGWGHFEWINLAYQSTADVILVMTMDNGSAITLTFPSTGGVQKKQFTTFPANKFKIVGWTANSLQPFTLFTADTEAYLAGWGTKSEPIKPFQEGFGVKTSST